jgi:hypothetical protein
VGAQFSWNGFSLVGPFMVCADAVAAKHSNPTAAAMAVSLVMELSS